MKKAVVLLSGGLDSTTCLALAKKQGFVCYALSFSYGQKHSAELRAAQNIAHHFGVMRHEIFNLDIGHLGGSALTDPQIAIPEEIEENIIPVTYVPARNTIFLSIALGWAEILEAYNIFIGISAVDYSNYPDCRPDYLDAFQTMATLATKTGVEAKPVHIEAPLMHLSKAETLNLGLSLGVDYSLTVSCYKANDEGLACGHCASCNIRKRGFVEAAVADPTRYIT
ncbi:MAG: queC [Gammaproteobacteria bacterium]|jgi:7-cyano-7-deazaguanine synthase|nr:queC [Gammaproteobacteria bacterium]